jgi:hypothetical protein
VAEIHHQLVTFIEISHYRYTQAQSQQQGDGYENPDPEGQGAPPQKRRGVVTE